MYLDLDFYCILYTVKDKIILTVIKGGKADFFQGSTTKRFCPGGGEVGFNSEYNNKK